jgi:hypothetical protein
LAEQASTVDFSAISGVGYRDRLVLVVNPAKDTIVTESNPPASTICPVSYIREAGDFPGDFQA